MAKLADHVRAATNLLEALRSTGSFEAQRQLQHEQLLKVLQGTPLCLHEGTEVLVLLKQLPLESNRIDELVAAVRCCPTGLSAKVDRKSLQDYGAIVSYFTEEHWATLQGTASNICKMNLLLQHAVNLGCTCPTETTVHCLTALYFILGESPKKVEEEMSSQMRLESFKSLKAQLKRFASALSPVGPHVLKLPMQPEEFRLVHSGWWRLAFGESVPVACKLSAAVVHKFMALTPMRSSRSDAKPALQINAGLDMGPQAAQFANGFLKQLSEVQQVQAYTLQLLQGGQDHPQRQALPDQSPLAYSRSAANSSLYEQRILNRMRQQPLALEDRPAFAPALAPVPPPLVVEVPPAVEVESAVPAIQTPPAPPVPPATAKLGRVEKKRPLDAVLAVQDALQVRSANKTNAAAEGVSNKKAKRNDNKATGKAVNKPVVKATTKKFKPKEKPVSAAKPPHWAWEATRGQIMCRTGLTGAGQSHSIKFKGSRNSADAKRAEKEANEWVRVQSRKK